MNQKTALAVAKRLNEMNVPPCDIQDELGQVLCQWTIKGGRLVVIDMADGSQKIELYGIQGHSPSMGKVEYDLSVTDPPPFGSNRLPPLK